MYTTINQDGQLNNYAIEAPVYYAEYPNSEQHCLTRFPLGW